ncbi:MAG TPA: haloacid dehalogenase type II [Candidatus Competibacteraceae bacterium]|nr:haloacid dehalogenase type II [Candidatus Competibacteraceae bacterium]MCP5132804.1 haloacid dehalogenase type II [Gammaproteobacteria bacterium]HPF57566.1 haloacid dehalogenase type II [Candidatus Competibacteraceae bacterium]HRY16913.1 haloacid dehalogenase type II [Candidatus Competibacteraceae bacterium]
MEKTYALGFDVYGTLVDPLALAEPLRALAGEQAIQFASVWRTKQLEYSFRRGLMRRYADFDVCTRQALRYTQQTLCCELPESDQDRLLEAYLYLPMFPEVAASLATLKAQGLRLVAFSNGVEASIRALLTNAGVLPLLEDVVSVDDLRTFKPDPEVYAYLARRAGRAPNETWLVSSNAWDVIGAKAAGLRAVWVKRQSDMVFDPWEVEPDIVVSSLDELPARFAKLLE